MSVAAARTIAQRASEGQIDASGEPCLAHAARVAAGVPVFARAVGWLHDAAERSRVDESVLIASGASLEERAALRLLSDGQGECSDDAFVERARVIARSPGTLGRIARAVKHADLLDNVSQRPPRSRAWSPPYGRRWWP
jgi:hypothetical protein